MRLVEVVSSEFSCHSVTAKSWGLPTHWSPCRYPRVSCSMTLGLHQRLDMASSILWAFQRSGRGLECILSSARGLARSDTGHMLATLLLKLDVAFLVALRRQRCYLPCESPFLFVKRCKSTSQCMSTKSCKRSRHEKAGGRH
jgi:hypothetical protein